MVLATSRERTNQPLVNYLVSQPAFSEGWALYAEDLADELDGLRREVGFARVAGALLFAGEWLLRRRMRSAAAHG